MVHVRKEKREDETNIFDFLFLNFQRMKMSTITLFEEAGAFQTGFHCVAQDGLEFQDLLPQPPKGSQIYTTNPG